MCMYHMLKMSQLMWVRTYLELWKRFKLNWKGSKHGKERSIWKHMYLETWWREQINILDIMEDWECKFRKLSVSQCSCSPLAYTRFVNKRNVIAWKNKVISIETKAPTNWSKPSYVLCEQAGWQKTSNVWTQSCWVKFQFREFFWHLSKTNGIKTVWTQRYWVQCAAAETDLT